MMCGWRTIPNDRATDIPIHIPGVKKPSGPGSESRSGRSAATRLQSASGPPKRRRDRTRAPAHTATYIHTPWTTSVQYTALRPPAIKYPPATIMRSKVPISKEIRSPEATEMMYPRPWACTWM